MLNREHYDAKKKDPTVIKQTFRDKILKKANNPDIFHKYMRDRREFMGESKLKGAAHQKKLADEQELTILKAIYQVEGAKKLDINEKDKLEKAGVMKKQWWKAKTKSYDNSSEELLSEFIEKQELTKR